MEAKTYYYWYRRTYDGDNFCGEVRAYNRLDAEIMARERCIATDYWFSRMA